MSIEQYCVLSAQLQELQQENTVLLKQNQSLKARLGTVMYATIRFGLFFQSGLGLS